MCLDSNQEPEEQLYLLEVLVDEVRVETDKLLYQEQRLRLPPIKIRVEFLNMPPFEIDWRPLTKHENIIITENETTSKIKSVENIQISDASPCIMELTEPELNSTLNLSDAVQQSEKRPTVNKEDAYDQTRNIEKYSNGRSCLFSMIPIELIRKIQKNHLNVQVFAEATANSPKTFIGQTKIYLNQSFIDAITVASTPVLLPISAVVDKVFKLTNFFEEVCGTMNIFIRLSCFGKTLFAPFQSESNGNYLFKELPCTKLEKIDEGDICKKILDRGVYLNKSKKDDVLPKQVMLKSIDDLAPIEQICKPHMELCNKYKEQERKNIKSKSKPVKYLSSTQPQCIVCTCPKLPHLLLPGLQPSSRQLNTPCECANILSIIRNKAHGGLPPYDCQPTSAEMEYVTSTTFNPLTSVSQKDNVTLTEQLIPLENHDLVNSLPQSKLNETDSRKSYQNVTSEMKEITTAPENIVPTSQVGGLELKMKNSNVISGKSNLISNEKEKELKAQGEENTKKTSEELQKLKKKQGIEQTSNSLALPTNLIPDRENMGANDNYYGVTASTPQGTPISEKNEIKPKKERNIYEYTAGMYPGLIIGHQNCTPVVRLVPKKMGWLWNLRSMSGYLAPKRGWRPGAVSKQVMEIVRRWKKAAGLVIEEAEIISTPSRRKLIKTTGTKSRPTTGQKVNQQITSQKDSDEGPLKPTLHLHKKDGFYYISMYPTKTESGDEDEPQPIQFKIDAKKASDDEITDSENESTDESMEIEFLSPAAQKRRKRKQPKTNDWTQYDANDYKPKSMEKKEETTKTEKKVETSKKKGGKKGKKK